jgi:hypothetical protein
MASEASIKTWCARLPLPTPIRRIGNAATTPSFAPARADARGNKEAGGQRLAHLRGPQPGPRRKGNSQRGASAHLGWSESGGTRPAAGLSISMPISVRSGSKAKAGASAACSSSMADCGRSWPSSRNGAGLSGCWPRMPQIGRRNRYAANCGASLGRPA